MTQENENEAEFLVVESCTSGEYPYESFVTRLPVTKKLADDLVASYTGNYNLPGVSWKVERTGYRLRKMFAEWP
jgi:hypothetical protein